MNQKTQVQELQLSDEINDEQIDLAKKQGEALQEALRNMTQKEAHGQQKSAGDYIIAWASEKAEGMYVLKTATSHGRSRRLKTHTLRWQYATQPMDGSFPV